MKKKKVYNVPKKVVKQDNNRLAAFVLLAFFIFTFIGSVLGIIGFVRTRKRDGALNVVSASANVVDDFRAQNSLNLTESLGKDLWYTSNTSFGAYLDDNSQYVHKLTILNSAIIEEDGYTTIAPVDYFYSDVSMNSRFFMAFSIDRSTLNNALPYFYIEYTGDGGAGVTYLESLDFDVEYQGDLAIFMCDVYIMYTPIDTPYLCVGFSSMPESVYNLLNLQVKSVSLLSNGYAYTYDELANMYKLQFTDDLKTAIDDYKSGIFSSGFVSLWLGSSGSANQRSFGDIPVSRFISSAGDLSLAKVPSYLREQGIDPVDYAQAYFAFVFYPDKKIYPSMLNFTYVNHYNNIFNEGVEVYYNLIDYISLEYLSFVQEPGSIPYRYNVDSSNLVDVQGNYIDSLVFSGNFTVLTGNTSYVEDMTLQYNEGVQAGFDKGYLAALESYRNELQAEFERGKNVGDTLGYNRGYTAGVNAANEYTFTGLLSAVIDVPIKAFTSLFNFEILGVNLANFFFALLTIAIILAIVKLIL